MLFMSRYDQKEVVFILIMLLLLLCVIKHILFKIMNKENISLVKYSHIGHEEIQEDYFNIKKKDNAVLAVIADGLGKNEAGRISSITAVKTISNMFLKEYSNEKVSYFLKKAINKANHEILKRVEKNKGGTSVLMAIIDEENLYYTSLGNLMLTIFRKGELIKLSEGHCMNEVAKEKYYEGKLEKIEALQVLNNKKVLYYLGQENLNNVEMKIHSIKLEKNDLLLIMSKGIYEEIRWVDFENILNKNKKHIDIALNEIIDEIEHHENTHNGSIIIMKNNM
ncbi:protein phosphatase [Clostridium botulinum]|uniref:PP2C family protein-serine/threonine phosphatase n=1 Tax=unclassified Clostridium TaxID=2614128 RepID=UPI000500F3D9|nr:MULTISPECIES: protein phosphatase 2C domain-containing protein [unclassified Clostridium]AIY81837.1 phosphatase 2C family protein [Clostridium botulinum 202F]KAI3344148.1 SpoIIE family protein phosphatase [Clostridium botulinum]KFX54936.1 protein phosphatase [Clostridium botulinum]KFX57661.1 protein phosphatase [Clostridium botulinum]KON12286.1 protein phosphatase [Clostridium botulinum]